MYHPQAMTYLTYALCDKSFVVSSVEGILGA
jgi:hypothetical protein